MLIQREFALDTEVALYIFNKILTVLSYKFINFAKYSTWHNYKMLSPADAQKNVDGIILK